jgi:hypothetical protein
MAAMERRTASPGQQSLGVVVAVEEANSREVIRLEPAVLVAAEMAVSLRQHHKPEPPIPAAAAVPPDTTAHMVHREQVALAS